MSAKPEIDGYGAEARPTRAGWAEAFKRMAEAGDDTLLDGDLTIGLSSWDDEDWYWPNLPRHSGLSTQD